MSPVNVNQKHWCMAVMPPKNTIMTYYDHLGDVNPRFLDALAEYLGDESFSKRNEPINISTIVKETLVNDPRQINGSDWDVFSCVFGCVFGEHISRN